ncbi:MAG: hypothetical protein WCA22_07280 [Candidatus Binatus sp.]
MLEAEHGFRQLAGYRAIPTLVPPCVRTMRNSIGLKKNLPPHRMPLN